jgi:hypothetical protein
MKLNIKFGLLGDKEVDWWKSLDSFPKTIKYLNVIYEWVFYDDDQSKKYHKILWFSELKQYDPRYNEKHENWNDIFESNKLSCCCGARYSSFPWDHLRYCPEWKKW